MSHSIGIMSFSKNLDEFYCVAIKVTIPIFIIFSLAEFGVHLAELTVDPQGALAIRQVSLPGAAQRILMEISLVFKTFFHVFK